MQGRPISLVEAGIPDEESEITLQNNGVDSGRKYKLMDKCS